MINNYLKRLILLMMVFVSIILLKPISAYAEWKQNDSGWWYSEGSLWATGWEKIEGNWYYFYQNGYMASNTQIGGYKIYSTGVAADSPSPKYADSHTYKWEIKANKNDNNKVTSQKYNYLENGNNLGEMELKNNYLYYKENGEYFTGWKRLGGSSKFDWYYMENGKRCLGWKLIDGNWYYFSNFATDSDTNVENLSGKMVTTSILEAGKSYEFDDNGVLRSTVSVY